MTNQMENTNGALKQSATLTRQAKADFSTQISALNGKLSNIGQSWVGEGSVAFIKVKQAWDNQTERLLGALEEFAQNLEGTDKVFNVTDADVTAGMNQLTQRLG